MRKLYRYRTSFLRACRSVFNLDMAGHEDGTEYLSAASATIQPAGGAAKLSSPKPVPNIPIMRRIFQEIRHFSMFYHRISYFSHKICLFSSASAFFIP